MLRSPQDVYARLLLSHRGYPLWTPDPSSELLVARPEQDGLRIGDVGVVIPEDGGFDIFFNLCLPRDHPFHQTTGVPDSFRHIELNAADIITVHSAEVPGQTILTSSVTQVRNMGASNGSSSSPNTNYEFSLSSSSGAVLILPAGAERHDLRDPRPFLDEAIRHGDEWYRFAKERLGRIISYDSIYLITGLHKARTWSLATYDDVAGNGEVPAQLQMIRRGSGDVPAAYSWRTSRSLEWRVGPDSSHEIPNQAVFIRGLKIALRTGRQGARRRTIVPRLPGFVWKELSRSIGFPQGDTQDAVVHPSRNHFPWVGPSNAMHVEIQRVPAVSQPFHPSDTINQYLLQNEPSANIAVTHDDDWLTLLEKEVLKPEELLQAGRLTFAVTQNFHRVTEEGSVYLRNKNVSERISGDAVAASISNYETNHTGWISEHVDLPSKEAIQDNTEAELGSVQAAEDLVHAEAADRIYLDQATITNDELGSISVGHPGPSEIGAPVSPLIGPSSRGILPHNRRANMGSMDIQTSPSLPSVQDAEQLASQAPSVMPNDGKNGELNGVENVRELTEVRRGPNGHAVRVSHPTPMSHTRQSTSQSRNIIFIGETGTGKSSTINLLMDSCAVSVAGFSSPTRPSACYETRLHNTSFKLWDTRGLKQNSFLQRIFPGDSESEKELKEFLRERYRNHEIDLLVYCVRGSRAAKALQKYYKTFCAITRDLAAPVGIVVTCLEDEMDMEVWWKRNSSRFQRLGMQFDGHTCITALPGHPRAGESKQKIVDLITRTYAWEAKHDGSYFGCPTHQPFSPHQQGFPRAPSGTTSRMPAERSSSNYVSPRTNNGLGSFSSASAGDHYTLGEPQLPSPVLHPSSSHGWLTCHPSKMTSDTKGV